MSPFAPQLSERKGEGGGEERRLIASETRFFLERPELKEKGIDLANEMDQAG